MPLVGVQPFGLLLSCRLHSLMMSEGRSKVFVGGLSWQTDDIKLRSYFENFGSVIEAVRGALTRLFRTPPLCCKLTCKHNLHATHVLFSFCGCSLCRMTSTRVSPRHDDLHILLLNVCDLRGLWALLQCLVMSVTLHASSIQSTAG